MGTTQFFVKNTGASQQVSFSRANGVNMPAVSPTVEDMNRILTQGGTGTTSAEPQAPQETPAFGTHIREGVEIVKDWLRPSNI